jgi:hypothetical protein
MVKTWRASGRCWGLFAPVLSFWLASPRVPGLSVFDSASTQYPFHFILLHHKTFLQKLDCATQKSILPKELLVS